MSSRSCPDWPELMQVAPELQFKHYTLREVKLPADAGGRITYSARANAVKGQVSG